MTTVYSDNLWETYTVSFPAFQPQQNLFKEQNNRYTILVVDDDQSIREKVSQYLKFSGYNVLVAETGAEALALIELRLVDLIFLDVTLPAMDGLAICAAIRKNHEIPIVMLPAQGMLDYAARAFQLGADGYITKPFALNTLSMRIQGLLPTNF